MLKRKRKLFTLGLTVFMSVTILCSNIAQASGISSVPDVETESYVAEETADETVVESGSEETCEVIMEADSATAEVSDGESESVLEDIEAEAVESSDSSLEETEEATESSSSEDMPEESCETSSEPEEGEKEVASDIVEESSEETVEEESENSEEISSENAEINDNSESTTEEESTEQNANIEIEENTEESCEITTEESIETETEDNSELPSEVIEEEASEEASEEAVLSSEEEEATSEEVLLPVDGEETSSEIIAEETAEDEQTEVFTMPTESIWASENFEVKHSIINYWEGGYQGEVVITNISDTTIEDWNLMFEMDTDIYQIWNASIDSNENGLYIIKNDNWNVNIGAGQSRSFGYLASYENAVVLPESYGISGSEKEPAGDSYEIIYEVTDMWEDGYVGNITITNLSDTELRNWKLSFDLNDEICDIWNAIIHSNENGQYVLHHAEHNAVISAGGSVTIGFRVQDDELQMYPENYAVKVIVHSEIKTEYKDDVIGIAYFEDITEDEICMADDGIIYAQNQLNLVGEEGTTFEQVAELGEEYGFEIVGYIEFTNDYQIKYVNDKTYEELNELIAELEQNELILEANLNLVCMLEENSVMCEDTEPEIEGYQPSDLLWQNRWDSLYCVDENDEADRDGSWGVKAINAPQAWEYSEYMSSVKIGLIDSWFVPHKDLSYKKIWNYSTADIEDSSIYSHGTHVAGIMAADFDNGIGIAGVARKYNDELTEYEDASYQHELYAYGFFAGNKTTIMKYKHALALMIGNEIKVINISLGIKDEISYAASVGNVSACNYIQKGVSVLESFLLRLISRGYDFVIVCSAGNGNSDILVEDDSKYGYHVAQRDDNGNIIEKINTPIHIGNMRAKYNSYFTALEKLEDRIIVVGAYGIDNNETLHMSLFSNIGNRVDIVAPGEYIESTMPNNQYAMKSGTSQAAPFVSGTAALLYSVNPALSGPQVKEIIVESAIGTLKGISAYEHAESKGLGIPYIVSQDLTEYKCLNADAAVEMVLGISGEASEDSENTGFILGNIQYANDWYKEKVSREGIEISVYRCSVDAGNIGYGIHNEYEYITKTNSDGDFSLAVAPGIYRLVIYVEGCVPIVKDNIVVSHKKISDLNTIYLELDMSESEKLIKVSNIIYDATTGDIISGAEIKFRKGWNSKGTAIIGDSVWSDSYGKYTVTLQEGCYTAEISKEGYLKGYVNIIVYKDVAEQSTYLSPALQEDEVIAILTWDDYDSIPLYSTLQLEHVNRGYSTGLRGTGAYYHCDEGNLVAWSQKATIPGQFYTPQTIMIYPDDCIIDYTYYVYIPWLSHEEIFPTSGACVTVYHGNREPMVFHVPKDGYGERWDVFTIENGEVVPMDDLYCIHNR